MGSVAEGCTFETERLLVADWRNRPVAGWPSSDLIDAVVLMLTPAVTSTLPGGWQGDYSEDRAKRWIEERDDESTVLEVVEKASGQTVGLMLIGDGGSENGGTDIRLGYMLCESAWGRGLASEMVSGFVEWARQRSEIASITGGVEPDNIASARVLEKCGFRTVGLPEPEGEQLYRLELR